MPGVTHVASLCGWEKADIPGPGVLGKGLMSGWQGCTCGRHSLPSHSWEIWYGLFFLILLPLLNSKNRGSETNWLSHSQTVKVLLDELIALSDGASSTQQVGMVSECLPDSSIYRHLAVFCKPLRERPWWESFQHSSCNKYSFKKKRSKRIGQN